MKEKLKVCWISAGVSSFISGYLAENVDEFIYIDIENQHPDSMRFIKDCERHQETNTDIKIELWKYPKRHKAIQIYQWYSWGKVYGDTQKRVRKEWEYEHSDYDITYVWGFDFNERNRADRLLESMPQFEHEFPLIDKMLSKSDAHGILDNLGIKDHSCMIWDIATITVSVA